MRKVLLAVLIALVPALVSAQTGVILPEGSNTLKALHVKGYPGLGIYSPSAGVILFGNETAGIQCTWGGSCVFTGAAAGAAIVSTLATNAPDVAASIWGVSNRLDFEGTTANAFETEIAVTDPTADRLVTLPDASGTVMLSTLATNGPDAANAVTGASNALVFEGSSGGADASETSITATNPTADRTVTLADASGTVMLSSLATNGADVANAVTGTSNGLLLEGATADDFETTLTVVDPTADQTITLPNGSGVAVLADLATNAPDAANSVWVGTGTIKFEGSSVDDVELLIYPQSDPATTDRSVQIPSVSGVFQLAAAFLHEIPDSTDGNPAAYTLDTVSGVNVALISCADVHGCTVTMGETGRVVGQQLTIVQSAAGSGNITIVDDDGTTAELDGDANLVLNTLDSVTLIYTGTYWLVTAYIDIS